MSFEELAREQVKVNRRRLNRLYNNYIPTFDRAWTEWGADPDDIDFLESENARLERYLEEYGD